MSTVIRISGDDFRPYEVHIGSGVISELAARIAALTPGRVVIVTDETVAALHGSTVLAALQAGGVRARMTTVPPGETSKSFAELERLIDRLLALRLERGDLILALGGGVVGDLAGLAAALYMRGIDFVQAPTTLLAQVDSSVGGKTAIDTPRGKNLVGAFHQPRLVLADIDFLRTLTPRHLRSGWAEVLKHGLICDPDFFDWLAGDGAVGAAGDPGALMRAVVRSVEIKSAIVSADEKEAGPRALLNLGHTFGHAIEAELGFDEAHVTHGEAVALGCVLAFRFSALTGACDPAAARRVAMVVGTAGLPTRLEHAGRFNPDRLLARMAGDKKVEGGRLSLVLPRSIGDTFIEASVDRIALRGFLTEMASC